MQWMWTLSLMTSLRDFDPDEVYRFLTRDNLELRARMLDHLKVQACRLVVTSCR